ncbi:polysaccharide biosynthesis C-terminal domain-containing protein [Nocardioides sp. YIM 152588]|uniref:oligosaccharide flippase family protein n=1 Tax=Nocardioides sp. YIM 152588 TaxID=3158259 RepID=UPI0032E4D55A
MTTTENTPERTPESAPDSGDQGFLKRATNIAMFGSFANIALGLISAVVISRIYGASILGEFALAYAAIAALSVITTLGEDVALVRLLAVEPPRSVKGSGIALATISASLGVTVVLLPVVAVGTAIYLRDAADVPQAVGPMLALLGGYLLFDKLAWNLDGVLSAYRAAGPLATARILNSLTLTVASAALAVVTHSVWAITFASLIASVVSLGYRLWQARPYLSWRAGRGGFREGWREVPGLYKFGLTVAPGALAIGFQSQGLLWILGALAPIAVVGAFSRAQSIAIRIFDVHYRLAAIIYPSLVKRLHEDRQAGSGLGGFVYDIVATLQRTFVPLFVGLCAAAGASRTGLTFFGEDFLPAEGALAILLVSGGVAALTMVFSQALNALGRTVVVSVGWVLAMLLTIALAVPLSREYGATGAALAYLVGLVAVTVILLVVLVRATPGEWAGYRLGLRGLAVGAAGALAFGVVHEVQAVGGPVVTVALGVVAVAAGAVVLVRRRRSR